MAREHEESSSIGKEASRKGNREDIDEYTKGLCKLYRKGRYLDEALFYRI